MFEAKNACTVVVRKYVKARESLPTLEARKWRPEGYMMMAVSQEHQERARKRLYHCIFHFCSRYRPLLRRDNAGTQFMAR